MKATHYLCAVALLLCSTSIEIHGQNNKTSVVHTHGILLPVRNKELEMLSRKPHVISPLLNRRPAFLSKPKDKVYVEAGKTLNLTVKIQYYKERCCLEVKWFFNNSDELPFKSTSRDGQQYQTSLTIHNVTLKNSGTYTLQLITPIQRNNQNFDVSVQIRPTAVLKCQNPPDFLVVGENFSCTCEGKNGVPAASVRWIYNNKTVGSGRRFEIRTVTRRDRGELICRVRSGILGDESKININVYLKPVAKISCSTSVKLHKGDNFSCNCFGNDDSMPSGVNWFRGRRELSTEQTLPKQLILKNTGKSETGTYDCRVQYGKLVAVKKVTITVHYPPDVPLLTIESSNTVSHTSEVAFVCKADAYPEPTYRISFNGSDLPGVVDGKLTKKVQSSDTGNYICYAKNTMGGNFRNIYLHVTEPRQSTSLGNPEKTIWETKWYILVVTLIAGIIVGAMVGYFTARSCSRFRKTGEKISKQNTSLELHRKSSEDSNYEELDLRAANSDDNYQSLTKGSRMDKQSEGEYVINDSAAYEELKRDI